MYHELLRIEDGQVRPVTAREATIREVRAILNRDKGSNGDADGRKKLFAYKELGAVYWIADFRSPGRMKGYEGQDLINDAIRNFKLPEGWQPDKTVSDLIKIYEDHVNGGVPAQVLTEIMGTFNLMLNTVKIIRTKLTEKLANPNITDAELKDLLALQNQLLSVSSDIPKKIKEIMLAKEMLKSIDDDTQVEIGRGGDTITSSMKVQ